MYVCSTKVQMLRRAAALAPAGVPNLLALLVQEYKHCGSPPQVSSIFLIYFDNSTNTDVESRKIEKTSLCSHCAQCLWQLERFTCFTSTKVQILTQKPSKTPQTSTCLFTTATASGS